MKNDTAYSLSHEEKKMRAKEALFFGILCGVSTIISIALLIFGALYHSISRTDLIVFAILSIILSVESYLGIKTWTKLGVELEIEKK
jgi:undecaprenyl pyrophosphate phosphatase UppP